MTTAQDIAATYCPGCNHPWGYHSAGRGCSMPVNQHGMPKMRNDTYSHECDCPVAGAADYTVGRYSLKVNVEPDRKNLLTLARDLLTLHEATGISLDHWVSARTFVETFFGPIEENGA